MKKLFLLLMLIFNVVVMQSAGFATEEYSTEFYVNAIKKKVEMNWIKPIKTTSASAVVAFSVNSDGSITPVSILRSSESPAFDESVVQAVYKAVPFEYSSAVKEPISLEIFFTPSFLFASSINNKPFNNHIVNVSNKSDNIDFSDYLNNLSNKINSNWNPKIFAKERKNIVSIKIDKDGALSNPTVLEPSNDGSFDFSTLAAVANSVPMDAFPANITAPTTNVQLNFYCKKSKGENKKEIITHYVNASVLTAEGSDKYTALVEKVLKNNLQNQSTLFEKKLVFEAQINSLGKLKYVKILEPSDSRMFNASVYKTLINSSFPQFPQTITSDSMTFKYELITGIFTGTRIFPLSE